MAPNQSLSRRTFIGTATVGSACYSAMGSSPRAISAVPTPSVSQDQLFSQFMARGPYPTTTATPPPLHMAGRHQPTPIEITYPASQASATSKPFPVALFSHGESSSGLEYNAIADLWASHGIICILPTHQDSGTLGHGRGRLPLSDLLRFRLEDLAYLSSNLDLIVSEIMPQSSIVDYGQTVVAAHGIGVLPALAMAGLPLFPESRPVANNVTAIISYNGFGPLPDFDDGWNKITVPVFAVAGTRDVSTMADNFVRSWRWRLSPYSLTSGPHRYGLSIADGDHSYGGGIFHREAGDQVDTIGLAIANALSTAFIHAHLSGDPELKRFLEVANIPALTKDRARLERA